MGEMSPFWDQARDLDLQRLTDWEFTQELLVESVQVLRVEKVIRPRPSDEAEMLINYLAERGVHGLADISEMLTAFWHKKVFDKRGIPFAEGLIAGVIGHLTEIDALLADLAEHWDVGRMAVVDRNILRLALYEMHHEDSIPPVVSLNEAIELAKEFSGAEAARFINGILDRALSALDRPARTASGSGERSP